MHGILRRAKARAGAALLPAALFLAPVAAQALEEPPPAAARSGAAGLHEFVGSYTTWLSGCGTCGFPVLRLEADGTFHSYHASMGSRRDERRGHAALDDGRLVVQLETPDEGPETRPVFLAVQWGSRRYLVPEEAAESFCDAVVAGIEPRDGGLGGPRSMSWLREDVRQLAVAGTPDLPAPWHERLAARGVEARLEDVTADRARIARGARDGLRPGLRLAVYDASASRPLEPAGFARVVATTDDEADLQREVTSGPMREGQWASAWQVLNPLELLSAPDAEEVRIDRGVGRQEARAVAEIAEALEVEGSVAVYDVMLADVEAWRAAGSPTERPWPPLERHDVVELTPVLINAVRALPLDRPDSIAEAARIVGYWQRRQADLVRVDFDADVGRITPGATRARLLALAGWAAWWAGLADDPDALGAYRARVRTARGR